MRDEKVREPQLQRAYVVPSAVTAAPGEAEALSLLAEVLGGGATSRFYDQLVRGEGAATYAGANYRSNGLDSSRFVIYGLPKPGIELRDLEARMDEVIADLCRTGSPKRSWRAPSARPSPRRSTRSTIRRRSPTSSGRRWPSVKASTACRPGRRGCRRSRSPRCRPSRRNICGPRPRPPAISSRWKREELMPAAPPPPLPHDRARSPHDCRIRQRRPQGPPRSRKSPALPASRPGWWRTTLFRSSP